MIRDTFDLQIKHISGIELETADNKVHEVLFTRLNKEENMKILDFVMIKRQQVLEEDKDINPIEIRVEDNKIQNIFEKYKNNKVRFKLTGLLFSNSVVNTTEKIFLQAIGLKSAKYVLLNDEYKQIIGNINLNQIENWKEKKILRGSM